MKAERKYKLMKVEVKPTYIVADETVSVKAGELKRIKVKKLKIPPNSVLHLSLYAVSKLGNIASVGEDLPKPMDMPRSVEFVYFSAWKTGTIKKGDFLNYFLAIPLGSMSK